MGKIKSWLFGKDSSRKSDKEAEAIAKLKKRLNSLEVEGRNLLRKADEQKQAARQMIASGNKVGAKQALTRSRLHMQKYNQIQNMSLNLSTQIDTIQTAKSTKDTVEALSVGSKVVNETLDEISPVDVERTMAEMDDQRDRISMMNDALADVTGIELDLDGEMADSIDEELAALEMEMQASSHGTLPEPGAKVAPSEEKSEKKEEKESENSDLEDELKSLQKELEGSK